MNRTFIESKHFTKQIKRLGGHKLLREIQNAILRDPKGGDPISGVPGLRKIRVGSAKQQKGKRGGHRVMYLDIPETSVTHLLKLFAKSEKEDLSSDEKKVLKMLIDLLKKEAKRK